MDTPARTSILVAAARAFAHRDPDERLRNPDTLAMSLLGAEELAFIEEHPLSRALHQDYEAAKQNPAVLGLAWLLLMRTRFIDEALLRAVGRGVGQLVILGAGFDTRAYRFRDGLRSVRVFEADAPPTQRYKKHRALTVLGEPPANLTYCEVDFSRDDLFVVLGAAGYNAQMPALFIWEGVSMYLEERSVRQTLCAIAEHSATDSSVVLDYSNQLGLELRKQDPHNNMDLFKKWGEPWLFGVADGNGVDFFRELGWNAATVVSTADRAAMQRYAGDGRGGMYGADVFARLRAEAEARAAAADPAALRGMEIRRSVLASGGIYFFAELTKR